MRRYREGEAGDPVFERLLGVEMKREQYEAGRAFCDTVVELTDEATLDAHVGLGRGDAVAARGRRASIVARPHRLTTALVEPRYPVARNPPTVLASGPLRRGSPTPP